jgi:hypothetical protein
MNEDICYIFNYLNMSRFLIVKDTATVSCTVGLLDVVDFVTHLHNKIGEFNNLLELYDWVLNR